MSLVLAIEISPFPASFPDEFGCSIVYVWFFPDSRQSNCTREKIDFPDQCRYDIWSLDDTFAFVIYNFLQLSQSLCPANWTFLIRIDCILYFDVYDWSSVHRVDSTMVRASCKHKFVVSPITKNALRMHAGISFQRELNLSFSESNGTHWQFLGGFLGPRGGP